MWVTLGIIFELEESNRLESVAGLEREIDWVCVKVGMNNKGRLSHPKLHLHRGCHNRSRVGVEHETRC